MCEREDINSVEEFDEFIQNATLEELYVLREDILNGSALPDDEDD